MPAILRLRRPIFVSLQQLQAPSAKKTEAILAAVSAMSWRDFALALEQAWQRDGYAVQRIEGAADFVLTRQGKLVQPQALVLLLRHWPATATP